MLRSPTTALAGILFSPDLPARLCLDHSTTLFTTTRTFTSTYHASTTRNGSHLAELARHIVASRPIIGTPSLDVAIVRVHPVSDETLKVVQSECIHLQNSSNTHRGQTEYVGFGRTEAHNITSYGSKTPVGRLCGSQQQVRANLLYFFCDSETRTP